MESDWKKAVWTAFSTFVASLAFIVIRGLRVSWDQVTDEQYMAAVLNGLAWGGLWWWATPDAPKPTAPPPPPPAVVPPPTS